MENNKERASNSACPRCAGKGWRWSWSALRENLGSATACLAVGTVLVVAGWWLRDGKIALLIPIGGLIFIVGLGCTLLAWDERYERCSCNPESRLTALRKLSQFAQMIARHVRRR